MAVALLAVVLFCPPLDFPVPDLLYEKPSISQPKPKALVVRAIPATVHRQTVAGIATWYDWNRGQAAAGPRLRNFLGRGWRGTKVTVCRADQALLCVDVTLTDWCLCGHGRVIDLDVGSFARLADPSAGILSVKVRRA